MKITKHHRIFTDIHSKLLNITAIPPSINIDCWTHTLFHRQS